MLTANQIDVLRSHSEQLLDPIIDFLIEDIAKRVSEAGQLTSSAAYQVWRTQQLGMSQRQLKKEIAKRLKVSQADVEKLLTQAAETGYNFDISRFPTSHAVPLSANSSLQQILDATIRQAQDDLLNMTQTIGFVGPDGNVHELTQAYQQACDFAFQKVSTGAQDYVSAVRDATRNLAKKGIRTIDYESGVHTSLEAAVRRNIMGGMGIMQKQISQQNHDYLGCNGWEISAHSGSAPDHEPIQGKQYTDEEYTRLNNSLVRRIGQLNCGHADFPIIIGVNSPQYTAKQLEEMRQENEKGITYEGKHYTLYEARQRQRNLESAARNRKRRILIDEQLGDKDKLQNDQIRLQLIKQEYSRFSKAAGLPTQHARMEKAGFGFKHAAEVKATAEDVFKNPSADLEQVSKKVDNALNRYCERRTKWSGVTITKPREEMPGVAGRKEWSCDITLREDSGIKTVVHEHLHARSVSYFDPETYKNNQRAEEGSVELFAQEICKINNAAFRASYTEPVKRLRIINSIVRISDDFNFAKQLFDIPLPNRYNWLRGKANELIATGKLSTKTVESLNEAVEYLKGKDGK